MGQINNERKIMKQKLSLVMFIAVVIAASLSGCGVFRQDRIAGTASTVLEVAYVAGGASMVGQRIDRMVADGKITAEQATLLKAAAQKSYADLQKRLKELSVADVEVTVTE